MEVDNLPDMDEKTLKTEVKRCVENEDFITAQNLIKSFGPQIEGYSLYEELNKIKKLEEKKQAKEA